MALVTIGHGAQNPSLWVTPDGIERMKGRLEQGEFAEAYARIKQRVDAALNQNIELPPRGSNWYHWYVCPTHGNRLLTGRQLTPWTWEHRCNAGNHLLLGDPSKVETDFDGCRLQTVHSENAATIRDAGLLYHLTGEKTYFEKARTLLLAYADKYAEYPLHTIRAEAKIGGGKIGSQSLDESTWLIPAVQGADLVWAHLAEAERQHIATRLLLPAAKEVILPHKMRIHNIQCWKNSAVGLVGFLLNDPELLKAAIDDPQSGFRAQIAKGVQDDGLWWENAWGYHFYTLSAIWPLLEAARHHGIDLYDSRVKSMFDAPLNLAMPNLVLPDFSDSHTVNLAGQSSIYELAFARYRDPRYAAILKKSNRTDTMALLFGEDKLPNTAAAAAKSANHPTSGNAILARGQADQATWLCMRYGPHGGGHGHPDKLHFVLYAKGLIIAPDAGITSYGTPLHGSWYRTTLAHNTLIVDETDQKPATGNCLAFGSDNGVDFVMAEAGPVYDGIRFVRTAALVDEGVVIFLDHVKGPSPRTLDIAFHANGQWAHLPPGAKWEGSRARGYQHLADATSRDIAHDDATLNVTSSGITRSVVLAGGDPTTLITATGIGSSSVQRVPILIMRRNAADTAFLWGIVNGTGTLKRLGVRDKNDNPVAGSDAAAVEVAVGRKTLRILSNPSKLNVKVLLPDGNLWQTEAAVAVR